MSKMREIQIEKVTLNVGVGQAGNELDKAIKLLVFLEVFHARTGIKIAILILL